MNACSKNLFLLPALIGGLGLIPAGRLAAQTYTILHSFTDVSDGSFPDGNQVVLSWPASAAGFALEAADSLAPPMTWVPVSEAPTVTGDQNSIAVSDPRGRKFYRLRKP